MKRKPLRILNSRGHVPLVISPINPFITSNVSLYFQTLLSSTALISKEEMLLLVTKANSVLSAPVSSKPDSFCVFIVSFSTWPLVYAYHHVQNFLPPHNKPWPVTLITAHGSIISLSFLEHHQRPSPFPGPNDLVSSSTFFNVYSIWQCWLPLPLTGPLPELP